MTEPLAQNRVEDRRDSRTDDTRARPATGELVKRVVSAIVLGGFGVGAIFAGVWALAMVVALASVVMAWEWGRLVRNTGFDVDAALALHAAALVAAVLLTAAGQALSALAVLAAGALAMPLVTARAGALSALGVPYIGVAVVGIIWLRAGEYGAAAVLFVFACVWAHDSFAMLVGRAIGGPRLWPTVSPRKTWSGAVAGWLAGGLTGLCAAGLVAGGNAVWLGGLGLVLAVAALLGDLAESGVKRLGRVKNTSGLIPGHGGFLDRFDGAIASFALAGVIALALGGEPATALLFGVAAW